MTVLIGLIIVFALLLVDLVTKALAAAVNVHMDIGIFGLNYTKNSGIAFSWFSSDAVAMQIITVITCFMAVLIAIAFFSIFKKNKPAQYALCVIEAGALGNLIDRLALGFVRDFVDVSAIGFGVCNIADFCITFGAVALIFIILFIGKGAMLPLTKKWREEAKAEAAQEKAKLAEAENKTEDE